MKYELVLDISYMQRQKYYAALYQIQTLVDKNGMVAIFVNNVHELEFKCCIHTNQNVEAIKQIIEQNNLVQDREQNFNTLMQDLEHRRYNMKVFPPELAYDDFIAFAESCFFFNPAEVMEQKGYRAEKTVQPKVFISYSHQDKDAVRPLVTALQEAGLNIWIDIHNIEVGENILRELSEGIQKSDIGVLFLSRHYKKSNYAQFELEQLMAKMIERAKTVFPVKVDDVSPDDIFYGLAGIKYYDYLADPDVDRFVAAISKKIRGIQKR